MALNKHGYEIHEQYLEQLNERFANVEVDYLFVPPRPEKYQKEDINALLKHASEIGASDIHIEGFKHVFFDVHSRLYPGSVRALYKEEVASLLKKLYDDNAIAKITSLEAIDTNHALKDSNGKTYRFRVNAIGTMVGGDKTVQITIRTLAETPPKLKIVKRGEPLNVGEGEIALEKEIWDYFSPSQGMVIVTGPTGSGKSTLMAAGIRTLVEQEHFNKKIITYEAPIEYVFDKIKMPSSIVTQTEIITQLPSFYDGVESGMRRKPDIVFIGEARDVETIDTSIMASQTGHLLYTTSHTNSVSETLKRLINVFPENERQSKLMDLVDSLQMIIAQRLLKTVDGKRCAVKEFLVFDTQVKSLLKETNPMNISTLVSGLVRDKKQRLIDDAYLRLKEGLISEETFADCEQSWGKLVMDESDIFDFEEHEIQFVDKNIFLGLKTVVNAHVGIVLDKNNIDHYGKICFIEKSEMDIKLFVEESGANLYFTTKNEDTSNKKIMIKLKKMYDKYVSEKK